MSNQTLKFSVAAPALAPPETRQPLGRRLVASGIITEAQLAAALDMQRRLDAPLGEILVADGWASRANILQAVAGQYGIQRSDLDSDPPEPGLFAMRSCGFWLAHQAVPWRRIGPMVLIATARPDRFAGIRAEMATGDPVMPVLAGPDQIDRVLARQFSPQLAAAAETRVPAALSCRIWHPTRRLPAILAVLVLVVLAILFPLLAFAAAAGAAVMTLMMFAGLRLAGFAAHLSNRPGQDSITALPGPEPPLPSVSILVPLHREREIASALIRRLLRLTYPKVLLDVILVLEAGDEITRDAISATDLPDWIRVIEVPTHNGLTTKPRAMNYALDFCRGDIVGVWDAEDAPEPDQIERVARRFAAAPPDVACLQGILDYYNPRSNWRARCFTIEYASWFRVVLPGIARLGLVVPLGGTTFFIRRAVLTELGGWDAHNVTEDADLGLRLARAGYRTEMIGTVTYEEANFRAWPWVRQRSRWLKGFMATYLVHMRRPSRLWAELGTLRFLGVQAFFLGTIGQFLLAPVLWSFWLMLLGWPHPLAAVAGGLALAFGAALCIATEALSLAIGLRAVRASGRRYLALWLPAMILYYPLGVVAGYKALWELAVRPFFWDKTQHGQAREETAR